MNTSQRYFALVRRQREQGPILDSFIKVIDLIIPEVRSGEIASALSHLRLFRDVLTEDNTRAAFDQEACRKQEIEVMLLKKETYELSLKVAELTGDEAAASAMREALSGMDAFFAAAIEDLDPGANQP